MTAAGSWRLRAVPEMSDADAALVRELDEIGARLAALRDGDADAPLIGPELGAIRAQLRILATQNAEVGKRLARVLGLDSTPGGEH
jgi:hypothetical protein